jgi:hypothetical protein
MRWKIKLTHAELGLAWDVHVDRGLVQWVIVVVKRH